MIQGISARFYILKVHTTSWYRLMRDQISNPWTAGVATKTTIFLTANVAAKAMSQTWIDKDSFSKITDWKNKTTLIK